MPDKNPPSEEGEETTMARRIVEAGADTVVTNWDNDHGKYITNVMQNDRVAAHGSGITQIESLRNAENAFLVKRHSQ